MSNVDRPRASMAHAGAFSYTSGLKCLRIQAVGASTSEDAQFTDAVYSDVFAGPWCVVAPPAAADTDGKGNVSSGVELLALDAGDENVVVGQRDTRMAKYAQDLKGGDCAFVNFYGSRLALTKDSVSLMALGGGTGAYINFNVLEKRGALVAQPASAGVGAPSLSWDTSSIGFTSATGAASFVVKGNSLTASGASFALDVGGVTLGTGGLDPVVTLSHLVALISQLVSQFAAHTHPTLGSVPAAPLVLVPNGSSRVKAAP